MSWQIDRVRALLHKLLTQPALSAKPEAILAAIAMGVAYLPVWQPRATTPTELLLKRAALVAQAARPATVLHNAKALLRLLAKGNYASASQPATICLVQAGIVVCQYGPGPMPIGDGCTEMVPT